MRRRKAGQARLLGLGAKLRIFLQKNPTLQLPEAHLKEVGTHLDSSANAARTGPPLPQPDEPARLFCLESVQGLVSLLSTVTCY